MLIIRLIHHPPAHLYGSLTPKYPDMSIPSVQIPEHIDKLLNAVKRQCHMGQAKLYAEWQNTNVRPKLILYAGLVITASLWLGAAFLSRRRARKPHLTTRPNTPNLEKHSPYKAVDRTPGGILAS